MSKLPEFLQNKSCFDGRPSPSVSQEFLVAFYEREKERKKHMKQCNGCGRWYTPKRKNQEYCTRACKAAYFSRVYWKQKQEEIDRELEAGGWEL